MFFFYFTECYYNNYDFSSWPALDDFVSVYLLHIDAIY